MKKTILILASLALLSTSCVHSLYGWKDYQKTSDLYTRTKNEKTKKALMDSFKKIIDKKGGLRKTVPPGICADYGYMLIMDKKIPEGTALLQKEMQLYPESTVYITRLLNKYKTTK